MSVGKTLVHGKKYMSVGRLGGALQSGFIFFDLKRIHNIGLRNTASIV